MIKNEDELEGYYSGAELKNKGHEFVEFIGKGNAIFQKEGSKAETFEVFDYNTGVGRHWRDLNWKKKQ